MRAVAFSPHRKAARAVLPHQHFSPFDQGFVGRHGGPGTDSYDLSVTQRSKIFDLTHNRTHVREWQPWEHVPCEIAEQVTQFPPRPCDG